MERLSSVDQAVLDLSLRRGVRDDVIAAVLRLRPDEVAARRERALEGLADALGLDDPEDRARLPRALRRLPARHWRAEEDAPGEPVEPVEPVEPAEPAESEAGPPAAESRVAGPPARRRRRAIAASVLVVGVAAGALVGIALSPGSGDDDSAPATPAGDTATEAPAADSDEPEDPGEVALEPPSQPGPMSSAPRGGGTARIIGDGTNSRLVLRVSGLPPLEEPYAVWLYNRTDDARLVVQKLGTDLTLDAALPVDPADYRYLDISREPPDGNENHSGATVLRAPIKQLLEGS